jgi:uncharacterized protein YutE (UPF0331/DUF86 family)
VSDVNLDRFRELAGHLRDAVRQLRDLGQPPRETFVAEPRAVNSAKYLLIVAARAALDICNHLAARGGARSPEDYADGMAIMAEIGVVDQDLKLRLMRMARFRNLLVHLYARVNDPEVHRVIREDLGRPGALPAQRRRIREGGALTEVPSPMGSLIRAGLARPVPVWNVRGLVP